MADCNQVDSNTTSVTVSWQPAAGGAYYTYSYDNSPITTTRKTQLVITGLTVNTTYTFNVTVHGRNVTGNSAICEATTCMSPSNVCFVLVISMDCYTTIKRHYSRDENSRLRVTHSCSHSFIHLCVFISKNRTY